MCLLKTSAKTRAVELLQSDNSLLEQYQNKRITMGKPDGFIEIEVGETFFDVLKALLARILSSLLQVFKIVLQIMYFFYRLTF